MTQARLTPARAWLLAAMAAMLSGAPWTPSAALAQDAGGAADAASAEERPRGIRFTPGMARGMAREFVRHAFRNHYELPEDREEEAVDLVTRRLMETAHKMDGPGQELVQRFAEEQIMNQLEGGGHGFMPPAFGKEFAERVKPLMPAVHDLVRNVAQDLRPMLPLKKQLQMAGELMALKKAMDGFEDTMDKWASGEVTQYGNPFDQREDQLKKDETGASQQLRGARGMATRQSENPAVAEWEAYLEDARKFYSFDDSQAATADSILREFKERAEALKRNASWKTALYSNRVWQNMIWSLPDGWSHPLRTMIEDEHETLMDDFTRLGEEFKQRLDTIPTDSQRRQAEERMTALLDEKGFGGVE